MENILAQNLMNLEPDIWNLYIFVHYWINQLQFFGIYHLFATILWKVFLIIASVPKKKTTTMEKTDM